MIGARTRRTQDSRGCDAIAKHASDSAARCERVARHSPCIDVQRRELSGLLRSHDHCASLSSRSHASTRGWRLAGSFRSHASHEAPQPRRCGESARERRVPRAAHRPTALANVRVLLRVTVAAAISCGVYTSTAAAEPPAASANQAATSAAKAPNAAGAATVETSVSAATKVTQPAVAGKSISDEARACFQKAQAAYATGDLFSALAGFQCAFEAAPSPELHYNLARVYERMGEAEASTQHYRAYLAQSPVTPRERKRIEARLQALQDLRDRQRPPMEATKPNAEAMSAEARQFYDRGVKLYRVKQYPAAQAAFNAALQLSNAPELHFNLAVVAERMNHPSEAVDHYRAYLASRTDAKDRVEIEERIGMLQSMGR